MGEERVEDSKKLREGAPDISGGLERGKMVKVSARTGSDLSGYVCDRDAVGLLLDVRHQSGVHAGYEFVPWHSIERVVVEG